MHTSPCTCVFKTSPCSPALPDCLVTIVCTLSCGTCLHCLPCLACFLYFYTLDFACSLSALFAGIFPGFHPSRFGMKSLFCGLDAVVFCTWFSYNLSVSWLCHVPSTSHGFLSICMLHSTNPTLPRVKFFEGSIRLLHQSITIRQYGDISREYICYMKLWNSVKRKEWNEEKKKRGAFRLTFTDKHCEIPAMAFQLSQLIFRNELTNCNRALQFPPLIIYFS